MYLVFALTTILHCNEGGVAFPSVGNLQELHIVVAKCGPENRSVLKNID